MSIIYRLESVNKAVIQIVSQEERLKYIGSCLKQGILLFIKIDKDIFMNDVLPDIDMEENGILLNPMSNESLEFYPYEVIETIEE